MWKKIIGFAPALITMFGSKNNKNVINKEENFLSSKKFFIVFTSIILLATFYAASVFILFLTASIPVVIPAFVTIFVETIKIFAIIISAYLGLQTAIDFRYNSNSENSYKGENSFFEEKIIREGASNAPKIKPFSVLAIEE